MPTQETYFRSSQYVYFVNLTTTSLTSSADSPAIHSPLPLY